MSLADFNPRDYGPAIADLLSGERLPELGPGSPNADAEPKIRALAMNRMLGGRNIASHEAVQCCLAGLWLWHDFLDESHRISQEIDTAEGSYWHAIMHRREPDYGNSKYWLRRVGVHPIFEPLAAAARELASQARLDGPAEFLASQSAWDPYRFVDLCEAIARGRTRGPLAPRAETKASEVGEGLADREVDPSLTPRGARGPHPRRAEQDDHTEQLARQVAAAEWRLLFDHCFRQATGEP